MLGSVGEGFGEGEGDGEGEGEVTGGFTVEELSVGEVLSSEEDEHAERKVVSVSASRHKRAVFIHQPLLGVKNIFTDF
ncbi:hypothetical protein AZI87_06120 [Bdellovibrio bacteriovorus]|uniref:Uncharacterized protein n=1 Tax=Bdellovibrio bacteriovorus TaxID=959 RepID=A0A162GRS6_BDEBC|nr:hypothetical protein AZI87_06120 [Bdellovibrio bacteriovorus]